MDLTVEQRRLLGAFLRTRREALPPRTTARRRTPGLRREDVADLCGISATWYTWLEQGRDIALSAAALARLAQALGLTPPERAYLFELTHRRDPASPAPSEPTRQMPADLATVIRLAGTPAYLMNQNWDALGWNVPAGRLFASWLEGRERNLLRYVFLNPAARELIVNWDERARRIVAEFRADTVHRPTDAAVHDLVADLQRRSPVFAALWGDHAVLARDGGLRQFNHPEDGALSLVQVTLAPAAHPALKLVMLVPPGEADASGDIGT